MKQRIKEKTEHRTKTNRKLKSLPINLKEFHDEMDIYTILNANHFFSCLIGARKRFCFIYRCFPMLYGRNVVVFCFCRFFPSFVVCSFSFFVKFFNWERERESECGMWAFADVRLYFEVFYPLSFHFSCHISTVLSCCHYLFWTRFAVRLFCLPFSLSLWYFWWIKFHLMW